MAMERAVVSAQGAAGSGGAPSVLGKAFDVLGTFSQSRRVLSLAEISRRSGLAKSTAHRVLAMLLELGAVELHPDGYRMGLRMFSLGALPPEGALRDVAMVHLEELHRVTGHTLHLATLRGGDVVYLEKLHSRAGDPSPARVGSPLPAHCTGVGKALLAFSDDVVVAGVLSGSLPRRTAASVTSGSRLHRQLCVIRTRGFAADREEALEGLACVAVPVLVERQPVAAISVAFPASAGSGEVLVDLLRLTSAGISRSLLGSPALDAVLSASSWASS